MAKIKHLREQDIIDQYFKRGNALSERMVGIGDDCAVYPPQEDRDQRYLVTTDALVEDTHFRRKSIDPEDLGYKSVAVNLSDIAAMGGRPNGIFVNIALPKTLETNWLQALSDGMFELCESYEIPVLGGDTISSKKGIFISITATGYAREDQIKYRDGAKAGDAICVTGPLGESAAGLLLETEEGLSKGVARSTVQKLKKIHYRPPVLLENGQWLAKNKGVHAMMDLSDGITSDLPYIIKHNRLGANIIRELIPVSNELEAFGNSTRFSSYQLAEDGGEDYQLLFTVDPEHLDELKAEYKEQISSDIHHVGWITNEHDDLLIFQNEQRIRKNPVGFQHFSG